MNMNNRIQYLRKTKGISQEEFADMVGVSRQAVSKWESGQSSPDLDKVISMSEYFGVTTDYLLKGIEPEADSGKKNAALISKILYISSTSLIAIGLFCAFGGWYENQTLNYVWGSMIIHAIGIAGYFIGKLLSAAVPPFAVTWLNTVGVLFMPISIISGLLSIIFLNQGWIAPYPIDLGHIFLFTVIYSIISVTSFIIIKNRHNNHHSSTNN